jgi:uncharacterized membrane protein YczE
MQSVSTVHDMSSTLLRRLMNLYAGLILFGVSMALMIRARLGLDSWDVLHQGIARHSGLQFGWVVIAVGAVVLLLWIPLRQRPGVGTVSNVIVVGLAVDAALDVLPAPHAMWLRAMFLGGGIVANGVATGLYIGAGLGPGPRDGLMTGLAARGWSIRVARTGIELSVLAAGWLLGGNVGVGTVLYALAIGPLAHYFIPRLAVTTSASAGSSGASGSASDPVAPDTASRPPSTRTDAAPDSTAGTGTVARSSCPARA